MSICPPPLLAGDTIGIMAPSSHTSRSMVDQAVRWLNNYSYDVKIHPQTYAALDQSAGTPEEKVNAFYDLWEDDSVKAIMAARGGNRAGLMLPLLDYERLGRHPKILIGYSDTTALLNAIHRKTGIITFHGPALNSFNNNTEEKYLEQAFRLLAGMETRIPMWGMTVKQGGIAEGRLVGGNLSLISSLIGTPWAPDFSDSILFLEDAGDQMSRYDRMLIHLKNAGAFKQTKAVIFGRVTAIADNGKTPFELRIPDLIAEHIEPFGIPVFYNAPFGHGTEQATLPIGARVAISAKANTAATLELLECPVKPPGDA